MASRWCQVGAVTGLLSLPNLALAQQAGESRPDRGVNSNVDRLPPTQRDVESSDVPGLEEPVAIESPLGNQQGMSCDPILEQLVSQAVSSSPSVAAARSGVDASAGNALQASLYPNPSVGVATQEVGNDSAGQYGLFLQNRFVRGNKVPLRHQVACQEQQARLVEYESEVLRIEIAVRLAYFQASVAECRLQQLQRLTALADETIAAVKQLVEAEEMTKAALLQTELARGNLKAQEIAAATQRDGNLQALAALATCGNTDELAGLECDCVEALPAYTWDELCGLCSSSLRLARQDRLIQQASWQTDLECAQQVVDYNWQISVYYDESTNDVFTGAQVSRPLLWNDANQGNIQRANAELAAACQQRSAILQSLQIDLAQRHQQYEAARRQAALIGEQLVPQSREALRLTQIALKAGEIGYIEALVTQQNYAAAITQYYDALASAWRANAELERLMIVDAR